MAPGFAASIGRTISGPWAIEGGFRWHGTIANPESIDVFSVFSTFSTHYSQMAFEGRLRYRPVAHRFALAPSIGAAIIRGTTKHEDVVNLNLSLGPPFERQPAPDTTTVNGWFGVVFGIDGVLTLAPHLAFVPTVNAYWVPNRHAPPDGEIGLAQYGFDAGVGIAIRF